MARYNCRSAAVGMQIIWSAASYLCWASGFKAILSTESVANTYWIHQSDIGSITSAATVLAGTLTIFCEDGRRTAFKKQCELAYNIVALIFTIVCLTSCIAAAADFGTCPNDGRVSCKTRIGYRELSIEKGLHRTMFWMYSCYSGVMLINAGLILATIFVTSVTNTLAMKSHTMRDGCSSPQEHRHNYVGSCDNINIIIPRDREACNNDSTSRASTIVRVHSNPYVLETSKRHSHTHADFSCPELPPRMPVNCESHDELPRAQRRSSIYF